MPPFQYGRSTSEFVAAERLRVCKLLSVPHSTLYSAAAVGCPPSGNEISGVRKQASTITCAVLIRTR